MAHLIPALSISLLSAAAAAQGGFPNVPVPPGNPITPNKIQLGKALFFEEQMSSTHTVACATCHVLEGGGSDPRSLLPGSVNPGRDGLRGTRDDILGSRGVIANVADGSYRSTPLFALAEQVTDRRSMPVINAAFARQTFWDGRGSDVFRDPISNAVVLDRFAGLESQAVNPPLSDVEMAHIGATWPGVVDSLTDAVPLALASSIPATLAQFVSGRSYPALFNTAFGSPNVTPARIAMAIATYQRTLVSDQSPFDSGTLNPQQQRGRQLFFSRRTDCAVCHGGPAFQNPLFRYTGVAPQDEDLGRFLVTNDPQDRGRMRAPTLRNVELRAPFFHNGSARTLRDVVDFYARGGNFNAPNRDPRIRRLNLSNGERNDLVAFLQALTDPRVRNNQPPFDRPTLYTETSRAPQHYGAGTAGSGNVTPTMVAIEPPHLGHDRFAVGMDRSLGSAPAALFLDSVADRNGTPIAGVNIHVGMTSAMVLIPTLTAGTGTGNGSTSVVLPIPNSNILRSFPLFAQWIVVDSGGFAATDAVEVRVF